MKVTCPECGQPGYLERHHRQGNTYLYVAHPYYVLDENGRKKLKLKKCYLGVEDYYKHVSMKLGLSLSSPFTMTPQKLLQAIERLILILDAKTADDPLTRRQAAEALSKYADIFAHENSQKQH